LTAAVCQPSSRAGRAQHKRRSPAGLLVGREVRGRDADRAAAPVAAHDLAVDEIVPAEQLSRLAHVSALERFAHPAAADRTAALEQRRHHLHRETEARAQRLEPPRIALAAAAEAERLAHHHVTRAERLLQHLAGEGLRESAASRASNGTTTSRSMPSAATSSSFCASVVSAAGAACGRSTRAGCGSKVSTTAEPPLARERATAAATSAWCPRCTPSKLPTATDAGPSGEPRRCRAARAPSGTASVG
jgi:hypothetical protein